MILSDQKYQLGHFLVQLNFRFLKNLPGAREDDVEFNMQIPCLHETEYTEHQSTHHQ